METVKVQKSLNTDIKIYDKRTGQIMEYGISGATRTKADYFKTEIIRRGLEVN